ncbi:hypothetical protein ACVWXO_010513 [Bradyrhizobium sp. LM2.7]
MDNQLSLTCHVPMVLSLAAVTVPLAVKSAVGLSARTGENNCASNHPQRRLAAILVADVVGYSRLMGQDERGTLRRRPFGVKSSMPTSPSITAASSRRPETEFSSNTPALWRPLAPPWLSSA